MYISIVRGGTRIKEIERFSSKWREPTGIEHKSPGAGGTKSEDRIAGVDTRYMCSEGDCWIGSS
jgi:hypothetical protein